MSGTTIVYDENQDIPMDILEEDDSEPVDSAQVIFHVTSESFGYYEYQFQQNDTGDFISIIPDDLGIEEDRCDQASANDTNYYLRISKSRYDLLENGEYIRNDSDGKFVKICDKDGELVIALDNQIDTSESENLLETENAMMVDISDKIKYKKTFSVYKNRSTWNRTVDKYVKVPMEFGDYIEDSVTYGSLVNRTGQTASILRTMYNYDSDNEKVDYGDGTKFKKYSFKSKESSEDGNYIKETYTNINDWGDKWSPDSGSADQATSAKFNHKPYFTYKVYIYRSDEKLSDEEKNNMSEDEISEYEENLLTAVEKLNLDLENSSRENCIKGSNGEDPIIWEVGRHTRTNNFSYYRKGGPVPPTGYQGQPNYYEVNYVPERFRIVLPEENYSDNFVTNNPKSKIRDVTDTTNNKTRDAISFDKYSNSNDVEGCLAILGRLENNQYISMANANTSWASWTELLVGLIPELDEIFGRPGHLDITQDSADSRTRVFMKIDPLPDIETSL